MLLGAGLGLCLALVEQVLRRAWVQVQSGRQEGRIYLLAHPRCRLGLDERAEIGIFGDPAVARQHAEIESTPRGYVLHHLAAKATTRVNGAPVNGPQSLKDGDRIELGHTLLVFGSVEGRTGSKSTRKPKTRVAGFLVFNLIALLILFVVAMFARNLIRLFAAARGNRGRRGRFPPRSRCRPFSSRLVIAIVTGSIPRDIRQRKGKCLSFR